MTRAGSCAGLGLILIASYASAQGTLHVPADFPTIQAGIDAAIAGDTVLVAPGIYVETINFHAEGVTVASSHGSAQTTINGGGQGSVITVPFGEPPFRTLRGFTITGGTGSVYLGQVVGGGIKIPASGMTIEDCCITRNSAPDAGGGLFASGFGSSVTLKDCIISENTTGGTGGGLHVEDTNVSIVRGRISKNEATGAGGGTYAQMAPPVGFTEFTVTDATIRDNTSGDSGGGFYFLIAGHLSSGGIATIRSSVLTNNQAATSGGAVFGSADALGSHVTLRNSIVANNQATLSGGGVLCDRGLTFVKGCTLTSNESAQGGGYFFDSPTGFGTQVSNSIVRGNTGGEIAGGPVSVAYSNVGGGFPGEGNIDVDPQFVDAPTGDYHLAATSCCINAGDPEFVADEGETDIDGDARVLNGVIDMGADEATSPAGSWTDLGFALPGIFGKAGVPPQLVGKGSLLQGCPVSLHLSDATQNEVATLLIGLSQIDHPFKGGTMVPQPDVVVRFLTDAEGGLTLSGVWPDGLPGGFSTYYQFWIEGPFTLQGFTASNALQATTAP